MLHAPTSENKTGTEASRTQAEPTMELEQQVDPLGLAWPVRQGWLRGGEAAGTPFEKYRGQLARMQQAYGNQAVLRMMGRSQPAVSPMQTKLMVSQPGDEYEQEADRIADQVMRMPEPKIQRVCPECEDELQRQLMEDEEEEEETSQTKPLAEQITPLVQRQAEPMEEEEAPLQTKTTSGKLPAVSASLQNRISALKSSGQPLSASVRAFFEPRFGCDFSGVRVHGGSEAAQLNRELRAQAFTYGQDVYFGAGKYGLETVTGKRLLAHELTHVVQQLPPLRLARTPEEDLDRNEPPSTSTPRHMERLSFDILGADLSVSDQLVQAASVAFGTDIRVTSLEDMISRLESAVSPNRCVQHLTIWNHGRPGSQALVGTEQIRTRNGRVIRIPRSGFTLNWLLQSGNQTALNRLRNVFCCGATMRWLGCGSAGVEARGGIRSSEEQERAASQEGTRSAQMRFGQYPERYQESSEVASHGGSLLGATFGRLTVQSWADATCTTITAANDFVFVSPSAQLYRVGFGGEFIVSSSPIIRGHCTCNPRTGRPTGGWSIEAGQRYIRSYEQREIGEDYSWHLYLRGFRTLWRLRNHRRYHPQIIAQLRRLIREAASGVSLSGGLPIGDIRPWINIGTSNPTWAASTQPHLIFCFPDNCWRWIVINQEAIRETPSYTSMVLHHELLHAADMWQAAQVYRREIGDPPVGVGGERCKPVTRTVRSSWTDDWGQYINNFVEFYERRQAPTRHIEIYALSAASRFDRLTAQEILDWFDGVLRNIPPNFSPTQTFQAEQMVHRLFQNPQPQQVGLRQQLANLLSRQTATYLFNSEPEKGRSLLSHFGQLWRLRPDEHRLFMQRMR